MALYGTSSGQNIEGETGWPGSRFGGDSGPGSITRGGGCSGQLGGCTGLHRVAFMKSKAIYSDYNAIDGWNVFAFV